MANIVEILFEKVAFEELLKYLDETKKGFVLESYEVSVDEYQLEEISSLRDLIGIIGRYNEGSIYLNVKQFTFDSLVLPKAGIQIFKYIDGLDLSIDIEYDFFQSIGPLSAIQVWANNVSAKLSAESYYCGYEPAIDEETRFFTMNRLGPLSFSKESLR